MKSCPVCHRTFPDEYSFCLTDGTPLEDVGSLTEEPTVVRSETAKPIEKKTRGRTIVIFVLAALLSLSLGITAAVVYFFWPRKTTNVTDNRETVAAASPTATVTPAPTERPTSPTPKPSASAQPSQSPDSGEQFAGSDPGTTRIAFRPGRVVETLSLMINDRRSFVLTARAGQALRAEIADDPPDYCVEFEDESPTVQYRTNAGENYLTVVNTCNHPSRFTLTVSIR